MVWRRPDRPEHALKKRYGPEQVRALRTMLRRRTAAPIRLTCVTNLGDLEGAADRTVVLPEAVARLPSQYPKLWLHSHEFASRVEPRSYLYTDLDVVVLGDWRELLDEGTPRFRGNYVDSSEAPAASSSAVALLTGRARPDPERRMPPFSTSLFAFRPAELADVWDGFTLRRARSIRGWTGTDQKWTNWVLGRDVQVWAPGPRFPLMGELARTGMEPDASALLVTCTHRMTPWDPELRTRLPWLADAYPAG